MAAIEQPIIISQETVDEIGRRVRSQAGPSSVKQHTDKDQNDDKSQNSNKSDEQKNVPSILRPEQSETRKQVLKRVTTRGLSGLTNLGNSICHSFKIKN